MLAVSKHLASPGAHPSFILEVERFIKEFPKFTYMYVVKERPKDTKIEILEKDTFDLMFNSSGGNTTGYWSPSNSTSYVREERTLPMIVTSLHEYAHSQSHLNMESLLYENEAEIFEILGVKLLQRNVDQERQKRLGIENIPGLLEQNEFGDREFEELKLMYLGFRGP